MQPAEPRERAHQRRCTVGSTLVTRTRTGTHRCRRRYVWVINFNVPVTGAMAMVVLGVLLLARRQREARRV
jgi:hypothetical protein